MANMTVQGPAPTKPTTTAKELTGVYVKGPTAAEVEAGTAVIKNGQKSDVVARAQDALTKKGFMDSEGEPLLADKKLGPKTEYALKQFQAKEMGMKEPHGQLDKATLEKLGLASKPASWNAPAPKAPARQDASAFEPAKKPAVAPETPPPARPAADVKPPPAKAQPAVPPQPAAPQQPAVPPQPAVPQQPAVTQPAAPPQPAAPAQSKEQPKAAVAAVPTPPTPAQPAASELLGLQGRTVAISSGPGPYPPVAYTEVRAPDGNGGTVKTGDFTATLPPLEMQSFDAPSKWGTFQLNFGDQQLDIIGKDGKRIELQDLQSEKGSYEFHHTAVPTSEEAFDQAQESMAKYTKSLYGLNTPGEPMVHAKARQLLGAQAGLVSIHELHAWRDNPSAKPGQPLYSPLPMLEHSLRTFDAESGKQVRLSQIMPPDELKAMSKAMEQLVAQNGPRDLQSATLAPFFDMNWAIVNDPKGGRPKLAVGFPVHRDIENGRPDRMHTFTLDIPKGSAMAKRLRLED